MLCQHLQVLVTVRGFLPSSFRFVRRGKASVSSFEDFPFIGSDDDTKEVSSKAVPTITSIIEKTRPPESRIILKRWQENMIKTMGDTEFWNMMKRNKSLGKDFHILATDILSMSTKPIILDDIRPYHKSAEDFLNAVEETVALEKDVCHPVLKYRGRFDGIVKVNGKICILEWKTVHTSKRVTSLYQAYDSPMQMAAYAGAYNQTTKEPKVLHGLLVYVYGDGAPADVLVMKGGEFSEYWKRWLNRLENYTTMMEKEQLLSS